MTNRSYPTAGPNAIWFFERRSRERWGVSLPPSHGYGGTSRVCRLWPQKAQESQNGVAASKVARTSKSAVSRVSQPAACATAVHPADWEVGDTAGLSRRAGCATRHRRTAAENPRENE